MDSSTSQQVEEREAGVSCAFGTDAVNTTVPVCDAKVNGNKGDILERNSALHNFPSLLCKYI